MTAQVRPMIACSALALLATALGGGCGGGDPIAGGRPEQAGTVLIQVQWPGRTEVAPQLVPRLSDFIAVEITDLATGATRVSDRLVRPTQAPWLTEATYEGIYISDRALLTATAYAVDPGTDPDAVPQASGSMEIIIPDRGTAYPVGGNPGDPISLVMDSTVDRVAVFRAAEPEGSAGPFELTIGATLQLAATAYHADGDMVLVPGFTWASDNANASVHADGLVTGRQLGRAEITATEIESGVSGSATVEASSFVHLSGVNLPWINYGHDVGLAHTWEAGHDGFARNVARLRADLEFVADHGVKLVRVFVFCDLRGGIVFDDDGVPQSLDQYVNDDFQTLLDEADAAGLRLIPVLFDYTLADEVTTEVAVGEHPDLITDPAKRDDLLTILRPFLTQFGSAPTIYAWDIINEPHYATAVERAHMEEFVSEVRDLIREAAPEARVTLGYANRGELDRWADAELDLCQFHYYDWMESEYPLDFPAVDLGLDQPVIVGEIGAADVAARLELLRDNGYAGVLFWSLNANHSFRDVADDYRNWMEVQEP